MTVSPALQSGPISVEPLPAVTNIAIVGSGFAGLGMAIQLRRHGFAHFVVLERAASVGGVWRDNQYPGAACDVQSQLYEFSFAPNPAWSRVYASQPEIRVYLERCARDFGVLPHIHFNQTVRSATWDAVRQQWRVECSGGTLHAAALLVATGALSTPAIPALPGVERFQGPRFHSAEWDHSVELAGRRVAVIGTGASAIQLVPEIQPEVALLTIVQRTPPWVLPRNDRAFSAGELARMQRWPALATWRRARIYALRELMGAGFRHPRLMRLLEQVGRRYLARTIRDPQLRARLTPRYIIGCKRVLISDTYLPALNQPNVQVVSAGIAAVTESALIDTTGATHPADVLIYGTGFQVTDWPFARVIRGRDGQTLSAAWAGSPQAYRGTMVAGFPNLLLLQGPNTGLGHTSVVLMIEAQIGYAIQALLHLRRHGLHALEPLAAAQQADVAAIDARLRTTVWNAGGCASWYLDATGRNSTLWPGSTWEFRRRLRRFDPQAYQFS